jgi:predicted component of type VI protein secretion system
LLKVADWKHIVEVVKQARHGVRAEVEWNPSSSLPLKPGVCFFRLRREGPFWEEIAKSGTLALYLPSDADWKDAWLGAYAVDPTYLR